MALKIKFDRAVIDLVPSGEATATVEFRVRDDATVGKLLNGVSDQVNFVPSFPLTKVSLRNEAVSAIRTKYTGAIEE